MTRSILHVTVGLDYGGVERALLAIAVAQKAAGHDVAVLALKRDGPIGELMRKAGINVVVGSVIIDLTRLHLSMLRDIANRVITIRQFSVVHSHLYAADVAVRVATTSRLPTRLLPNAVTVTTWHGVVPSYPLRAPARRAAPRLYRGFDAVVAVSKAARDSWCDFTGVERDDVHVIPNPVAQRTPLQSDVDEARAAFGHDAPLRLLCVGRLVDDKRFDLAIDALTVSPLKERNAQLVVVGEGPLRASLEARAHANGVADRVRFVGSRSNVEAWYAAADVLVMPSQHEGFGLVAVEAAAQGTPVAATRNDGLAFALEGCPAPAIDALTADAVARAVVACAPVDEATRASFRARFRTWASDMSARYSPVFVQRALDGVYDAAMARASRRGRR